MTALFSTVARPLTPEQRAVIISLWQSEPGLTSDQVAARAAGRFRRHVGRETVRALRPADLPSSSRGRGIPLSAADRAAIVAAWEADPSARCEEIAARAAVATGRPIGASTAQRHRPPAARSGRFLSPEQAAALVALWEAHPRAGSQTVARLAAAELGRPVSDWTARRYRPGSRRRSPPSAPAAAPEPSPARPRPRPREGETRYQRWIRQSRARCRRLGIGPRAARGAGEVRP